MRGIGKRCKSDVAVVFTQPCCPGNGRRERGSDDRDETASCIYVDYTMAKGLPENNLSNFYPFPNFVSLLGTIE